MLAFVTIEFGDILTQRVREMILDPGMSSDERTYIWRPILDKMMANPVTLITGFGWDAYDVMGFVYAVHNHYLWLLFELGIIGLASYLMVIAQLLIVARRAAGIASDETARYLIAFIYGLIALSCALLFGQLYQPWPYIWTYSGLTMRMAVIAMQTAQPNVRNEHRRARPIGSPAAVANRAGPRVRATQRSR